MSNEFHNRVHENLDKALLNQGEKISQIQNAVSDLKSQVSKIEGKIYMAGAIVGTLVSILPRLIDYMKQ